MSEIGVYSVRWTNGDFKELSVVSSIPTRDVQDGYGWYDAKKLVISGELKTELFYFVQCDKLRAEIKHELSQCAERIAAILNKNSHDLDVFFCDEYNDYVIARKGWDGKVLKCD